jgi:hypothetical protein
MSDEHEVYGPERAQRLVGLLRALAERIQDLDRAGRLLERVPELQKLLGNARSELFHYEVRVTYDTPEIAESRRIVDEAERRTRDAAGFGGLAGESGPGGPGSPGGVGGSDGPDGPDGAFDDDEDDEPWRGGRGGRGGRGR